jgi:hypothetical protein
LAYAHAISSRDLVAPAEMDPSAIGEEASKLIAELVATVARVTDALPAISAGTPAGAAAKSVGPKA